MILRAVELGQTVASSFSTPTIFQIANDLTKMQIDSSVAEADVGGVIEGQEVDFTVDAYPDRTFHGSVIQVRNSPTTVNNVVTYDCVIGVTNADYKLKPGMTANVSIIVAQRENALIIPNGALRLRLPDNAVVLTNTAAAQTAPATNDWNFRRRSGRPSRRRTRARGTPGFPYRLSAGGRRPGREAAAGAGQDRHHGRHFDRGDFGSRRRRAGGDRNDFNRHRRGPGGQSIRRRRIPKKVEAKCR